MLDGRVLKVQGFELPGCRKVIVSQRGWPAVRAAVVRAAVVRAAVVRAAVVRAAAMGAA